MFSHKRQIIPILNVINYYLSQSFQSQSKKNFFWSRKSSVRDFGRFECVRPVGPVSQDPLPPSHCPRPAYATGGIWPAPVSPERKSPAGIQRMRRACRLARRMLDLLRPLTTVGTTTEELNKVLWKEVTECGAYPSPLRYCNFPRSLCTSVNDVAVHGIPDGRPLQDGDIISVDVSVYVDGYHGDCADTWLVGDVDEKGKYLVKAVYECLNAGISVCKPGVPFAAIGAAIEKTATAAKVTVVPAFVGHGIGTYFHGPPDIYHFANNMPGYMDTGMTFTIEPVIAQGAKDVEILEDGWTAVMEDGGRAAQAEQTLLITDNGYEILTTLK